MNKPYLLAHIISLLTEIHQSALKAVDVAHEAATNEANKAENQYDTLGLEAAYLAHGQSKRVEEASADLDAMIALASMPIEQSKLVSIGSVVTLVDEADKERQVFIGPSAGGLKVSTAEYELIVITPSAPLGQALMGKQVDDEVILSVSGANIIYDVVAID